MIAEGDTIANVIVWTLFAGAGIGVFMLIMNRRKGYRLTCPYCQSRLNVGATVCRRCGRDIPPHR